MNAKWKTFQLVSVLAFLLFSLPVAWGAVASAQTSNRPQVDITGIDLEQFPDVRVSVYSENLGGDFDTLSIVLLEDEVTQDILGNERTEIGIQTAVLIDSSQNISDPGNTGDRRYVEIANAIERFVGMGLLTAYEDLLSVYSAGDTVDDFQTIATWNGNHQDVANQVRLYEPGDAPVKTPLFNLIKATLDEFESAPGPSNLRRSIVVFSDGFDSLSAVQIDDVVNRASREDVAIHTVMIGPEDVPRRHNLQRIADNTGGTYRVYDDIDAMEELWSRLAAERMQNWLTYRMSQARPEQVSVETTLPGGQIVRDDFEYPVVPVQPVVVNVVQPAVNAEIDRVGADSNATLADLEPRILPIELEFVWPDGHPRDFKRIEYEIGGHTESQSSGSFGVYDFPIDQLDASNYTLRVFTTDELGLESKSAPVSFSVSTSVPTPVPDPTEVPPDATSKATSGTETTGDDGNAAAGSVGTDEPSATAAPDGADEPGTVTIPPVAEDTQTSLLGGFLIYDTNGGTWGTLTIAGFELPLTPLSVGLIALLLLLLIGGLIFLLMGRKGGAADADLLYDEGVYTSATIGAESTMVEATAYELTEDATEPQLMPDFITPAALEYVEGEKDVELPKRLAIDGGREVRLGRKDAYCDIIIDDPRISRLHCAIQEKEDGKFYIRDEGSSGGTFVNRRKLSANDMRALNHGDIINFNTVAYRFVITEDEDQEIKMDPSSWTAD